MFFCSSSWSEMSEKLKATDCQLGKLVIHCQCPLVQGYFTKRCNWRAVFSAFSCACEFGCRQKLHLKQEKMEEIHVLLCWMFSLGRQRSIVYLEVLRRGLRINILQFFIKNVWIFCCKTETFSHFLVTKKLDLDPDPNSMNMDPHHCLTCSLWWNWRKDIWLSLPVEVEEDLVDVLWSQDQEHPQPARPENPVFPLEHAFTGIHASPRTASQGTVLTTTGTGTCIRFPIIAQDVKRQHVDPTIFWRRVYIQMCLRNSALLTVVQLGVG